MITTLTLILSLALNAYLWLQRGRREREARMYYNAIEQQKRKP